MFPTLNRTQQEIEQLYEDYEKLVYSTAYKRYGNPNYRDAHGLEMDDILQFGRMGLFRACKTHDSSGEATFATHAIRNIVWSINTESKLYSLGNINNRSNVLADRFSMDA